MPFSSTAQLFFTTFVKSAFELLKSAEDKGKYLRRVHEGLNLSPQDWGKYSLTLKPLLGTYQWEIPPDDHGYIARQVWNVPLPAPRQRPICCRDKLVQTLAMQYVKTFQQLHPEFIWRLMLNVCAAMMTPSKPSRLFRSLGFELVEMVLSQSPEAEATLSFAPEAEWTWIAQAWDRVKRRGYGSLPKQKPQDLAQLKQVLRQIKKLDPTSEPQQLTLNKIDPADDEADVAKQLDEVLADDTYKAYQTDYKLLLNLCYERFKTQYKESRQRPYLCVYKHPGLGLLFVVCSIKGSNVKKQIVLANGRFGHSGETEVVFQDLESIIGPSDDQDEYGARTRIKAVKYVEGGYGKYWINIKDPSRPKNDVFEAYFILKNEEVVVVPKAVYDRRVRQARKNPQAPQVMPTFDIVHPN